MAFTEFTLDSIRTDLGLTLAPTDLFPDALPVAVPPWLTDLLARARRVHPARSEKARSEAVISPVLMAAAELGSPPLVVHSGERLDVDPARKLNGEADYLVARSAPVPFIQAPLLAVVEAKKLDIDAGLGQCVAQMEAARLFNQKAGTELTVFGCVTTGSEWQFLRHDISTIAYDTNRYAVQQLDLLLGVFHEILK